MFKQRFNIGEITKDAVYIDAERRFSELEKETTKLHAESKKYFDAINAMLDHQIEFSKAIAEIYKPISGRASDPDSYVIDGNPEGIRACEEYEAIVRELKETLAPELELIDTRIVRPALELLEVIKVVRKTATKRDHKQLDYDRTNSALKKLQDKKEKTLKDEKAIYKAESDFEQATQEYQYFNDLLKDELPKLFNLEREFIGPLFQSFYYMQLNVFYTLHEKMQSIDIGYFNLTLDIQEAFEAKRGDIKEQAEALAITKFKTTGGKGRGKPSFGTSRPAIGAAPSRLAIESGKPSPSRLSSEAAPPPYGSDAGEASSAAQPAGNWGVLAASKAKPPPPTKPKPSALGGQKAETCTALYDYEAQAEGDLSFSAGDVIEIITRTSNENEWWTGKVAGREGQFPGTFTAGTTRKRSLLTYTRKLCST